MGAHCRVADVPQLGRSGRAPRPRTAAPRPRSTPRGPPIPIALWVLVVPLFLVPSVARAGEVPLLAASRCAGTDSVPGWGRGLGLGLVFTFTQSRDGLLAPLRWKGPGLGLQSSWTWGPSDATSSVGFDVHLSILSNRFGHRGYALAPELSYGYLRRVAEAGTGASGWAGGRLPVDLFNGFYESWDDEHLYWVTAYSVGPTVAWRGRARGIAWWGGVDLPVLAAVSRPSADRLNQIDRLTKLSGHFVDTQKHLALATVPEYVAIHATLGTHARLAGLRFMLSYDLDWSTFDSPSRVSLLRHSVTVARGPRR